MTPRKDTLLGKKLVKVPRTTSTRLTDITNIVEEQKNDPSIPTETESLPQTSQSNNHSPPYQDLPQTSQLNDNNRLPLDEVAPAITLTCQRFGSTMQFIG